MAKPSKLPEFAISDVVSPISGKPNVVEPDANHKTGGWSFGEFPARGFMNWIHRLTYQWIKYFDDTFVNLEAGTVEARLFCGTGFLSLESGSEGSLESGFIYFDLEWFVMSNMLFLKIPFISGLPNGSGVLSIQIMDEALEHFLWKKDVYCQSLNLKSTIQTDILECLLANQGYIYTTGSYSGSNSGFPRQIISIPIYDE